MMKMRTVGELVAPGAAGGELAEAVERDGAVKRDGADY